MWGDMKLSKRNTGTLAHVTRTPVDYAVSSFTLDTVSLRSQNAMPPNQLACLESFFKCLST